MNQNITDKNNVLSVDEGSAVAELVNESGASAEVESDAVAVVQSSVEIEAATAAESDESAENEVASLEAVAFVGEILAPFFLQDPRTGDAGQAFVAMATIDASTAAAEWPFVAEAEAARDLNLMVQGLAASSAVDTLSSDGAFEADDDLMWEYRRLFVGPNKKPAPPWGSVYTDRECVVFGESTLALRAWMREQGIARTTDERTPEDHIGLMLSLMAWIALNQPAILNDYLRFHLLTWSSHFLDELEQAAIHPFYQGLARLTRASLGGIQQERNLKVVYPKFYR